MKQNTTGKVSVIILAAGKGTRMKSDLAKVLHSLCGKPMLTYSINVAHSIGADKIAVVIGHQADAVREAFKNQDLIFIEQREQRGTGHAVLQARDTFRNYHGTIIILCGDVPLLPPSTVMGLFKFHTLEKSVVTVLTTILDEPRGYGRIVKGADKKEVLRIVEEKDASPHEREIKEINTGIYCVDCNFLFQAVSEIGNENIQKEYYLTDIVGIAREKGLKTRSLITTKSDEVMGINTPDDLERASRMIVSS
jgi:UDP-N-acetylglucosamine diphosphorylase/glucosamine-1-phosphate N-acetyltransferase